jgi:hypothetical protein
MESTSIKNFYEFMRNLPNLLVPLKIQTNFRYRCFPKLLI